MIKQTYFREGLPTQKINLPVNHHILSIESGFNGEPAITFISNPEINIKSVTEPVVIEQYRRGEPMDLSMKTERVYLGSYFSQVKNATIYVFKKIN